MHIFNNADAMSALWDFLRPLADAIPIYKQTADESEEGMPPSYLLIRTDVTDAGAVYGDGKAMLRRNSADLMLISKCTGALSDDIHNVNRRKIKAFLDAEGASYTGVDLGYNSTLKEAQYTWSLEFLYG